MRKQAIVEVFRDLGGASTARLAQECIKRGVFADEELEAASIRWAQSVCRDVLKEIDPLTGLPYAGPTPKKAEDGGPLWRQLPLMDYEDLAFCIKERGRGIMADYEILRRMKDYCYHRFGKSPAIPEMYIPFAKEASTDA